MRLLSNSGAFSEVSSDIVRILVQGAFHRLDAQTAMFRGAAREPSARGARSAVRVA